MKFYDAHLHNVGNESGGFLIGLEGAPWFKDVMHNEEAEAVAKTNSSYKCFRYVTRDELLRVVDGGITRGMLLKYHPRREKYTPGEVIESIRVLRPGAVMIDTLNEPYWVAYDYWKVAREFPDLSFILAHAGGYLINDFIKICHFQPNVWIDFTLTHTNLGGISKNPLPFVDQAISYAVNASFRDRILMGSDLPFFNQMDVVQYYERLGVVDLLNGNFERLFCALKC